MQDGGEKSDKNQDRVTTVRTKPLWYHMTSTQTINPIMEVTYFQHRRRGGADLGHFLSLQIYYTVW